MNSNMMANFQAISKEYFDAFATQIFTYIITNYANFIHTCVKIGNLSHINILVENIIEPLNIPRYMLQYILNGKCIENNEMNLLFDSFGVKCIKTRLEEYVRSIVKTDITVEDIKSIIFELK